MSDQMLNGRYRLDGPLGSGGMASVWQGWDLRLDRPVAVKILDRAGLDDPAAAERFDREARTVARLAHPNIVAVYDVGTHDGTPFLVMELVDGATVADLVAGGPLPVARAVDIAEQICAALGAAHAAGVIHRDIKPANVMVTGDGRVKVCDFGIARHAYAAAQSLTAPATALGTGAYMAPEQAAGDPVDARTDLYALGCVIYTMLTGAPPFVGERALSVLYQHVQRAPEPLRALRGDVPAELDDLVGRLLAKNPAGRPADAHQVRDQLAAVSGRTGRHAATAPVTAARAARATAAVVSPTQAFPTSYQDDYLLDEYAARPSRSGRRALPLIAACAIVLVIAALLVADLLGGPSGGQHAAAPPAAASSTPASPTPSSPSTSLPSASTFAGAVQILSAVLQQQLQAGQIDPGAASDLGRQIDELGGQDPNRRGGHKLANRIDDLRSRLSELRKDGKLTVAGFTALNAALDQVAATLPSGGNDGGDGGH